MLLTVHSELTLCHFVYFAGLHLGVWVLLLDSDGLRWCCDCSFKAKKKVGGWGLFFGYLNIFFIILFWVFLLFCHVYCAFFKWNIPKIFVLISGSIIFFLLSLLVLLMFYKNPPNWYAPFERLKFVFEVQCDMDLTALWNKQGWRCDLQKSSWIQPISGAWVSGKWVSRLC